MKTTVIINDHKNEVEISFFHSGDYSTLTTMAKLLFIYLNTLLRDNNTTSIIELSLPLIKHPLSASTISEVVKALAELESSGLIIFYLKE